VKPPPAETTPSPYDALDLLATMVAVIDGNGHCEFVNTSLEDMLGLSRRAIVRSGNSFEWFDSPALLQEAVGAVLRNEVSTQRFEAQWQRAVLGDHVQVHVIVTSIELGRRALVEVIEVEKQVRQDREERAHDQGEVGKELVRNLAHEIRNPLGCNRWSTACSHHTAAPRWWPTSISTRCASACARWCWPSIRWG
jgi:two-component system, NtrC family, nitrogen regulation sensor histidine kinase GlnL